MGLAHIEHKQEAKYKDHETLKCPFCPFRQLRDRDPAAYPRSSPGPPPSGNRPGKPQQGGARKPSHPALHPAPLDVHVRRRLADLSFKGDQKSFLAFSHIHFTHTY